MNIIEIKAYKCGHCSKSFAAKGDDHSLALEMAQKCCICPECGKPKKHNYGNIECEECRPKLWTKRDATRIGKMKTVPYVENTVLNDDAEKYLFDEDSLWCWFDGFESIEDIPDYLLICRKDELHINAESVAEHHIQDEHYEDAMDQVGKNELHDLQMALDKFCKDVNIVSWYENGKEKVSTKEIMEQIKYERDL